MVKGRLLLLLAWILICPSETYVHASVQQKALRSRQIGTESQIVSRMFSEYDPNVRPPVRDSADHSSIVVIVSIYINRVNWEGQTAVVDLYLRQQYEDSRLTYEVDPREKIDEITVPLNKKVWNPDTYFTSAQEINPDRNHKNRFVVEPSGFIRSSEQKIVTVPLESGSSFPFVNERSFRLRLSSYGYPIDDVVYLWANNPPTIVPVEVSKDLLDGPYSFSEAFAGDCVGNYTVGVHSCVDVTVTFTGHSCDAYLRFFIPTVLLVISSWLHFFIHGSWSVPRTISAAFPFVVFAVFLVGFNLI
ncbi:hypothetical protein FO519_004566 [Halicephalobus sp. NKZ332]|nr:hypothetical protein FO519_004566 [Halicephalobus sp. NKZ332]